VAAAPEPAPAARPAVTPTAAPKRIGRRAARPHVRDARVQRASSSARHTLQSPVRVAPPVQRPERQVAAPTAPAPSASAETADAAPSPFSGLTAAIDAAGSAVGSSGGGVAPIAILVLLAFAGVLLARGPRIADIAVFAPAAPFLGRQAPPG
jgi:hypothetical protein